MPTPVPAPEIVLVDFDDTLVNTATRFRGAREALFARLAELGFDDATARHVHHHEVDPVVIERYGLGPARIEPAFRETYFALCARARLEPDPATADALAALADGVAEPPPPLDGAIQALARLAERWPTALYTQAGEPEHQLRCIRASGVLDVLPESRVHICERKTPAAYRATLERFGVRDAARSWMVGNSVKSDINPALTVGANAILVEAVEPWIGDIADPVSEDFMRFPDFPAAVEFLTGARLRQPAG